MFLQILPLLLLAMPALTAASPPATCMGRYLGCYKDRVPAPGVPPVRVVNTVLDAGPVATMTVVAARHARRGFFYAGLTGQRALLLLLRVRAQSCGASRAKQRHVLPDAMLRGHARIMRWRWRDGRVRPNHVHPCKASESHVRSASAAAPARPGLLAGREPCLCVLQHVSLSGSRASPIWCDA